MNKILIVSVMLAISGCTCTPEVREVRVVVTAEVPQPPGRSRPDMAISSVADDTPDDVVVKKYAATVKALRGYAESLEKIIDGYRIKKPTGPEGPVSNTGPAAP